MAWLARSFAAFSLLVAPAAACVDLFHSTEWKSRCDTTAGGCPGAGPTSGVGGSGGAGGAEGGATTGGQGGAPPGPCTPGEVVACYSGPEATKNVGVCAEGTRACGDDGMFEPCVGEVLPTTEICGNGEDEDCDGSSTAGCLFASCGEVVGGSGVYVLDPNGGDPADAFEVHCDMDTDGGPWAMLLNSIGSGAGTTLAFWQIPYADRLAYKGKPFLYDNFYAGVLYTYATEYRDEIQDLSNASVEAARVNAAGFDPIAMTFTAPALVAGNQSIFDCHFAAGWSSSDQDGDTHVDGNCAALYAGVAQHYCGCWYYNLGADADAPYEDAGWGPHLNASVASALGLGADGSGYTRVARITRWARW